jgi:hypothetical protein
MVRTQAFTKSLPKTEHFGKNWKHQILLNQGFKKAQNFCKYWKHQISFSLSAQSVASESDVLMISQDQCCSEMWYELAVKCDMNLQWNVIWTGSEMWYELAVKCDMNLQWNVIWTCSEMWYEIAVKCDINLQWNVIWTC